GQPVLDDVLRTIRDRGAIRVRRSQPRQLDLCQRRSGGRRVISTRIRVGQVDGRRVRRGGVRTGQVNDGGCTVHTSGEKLHSVLKQDVLIVEDIVQRRLNCCRTGCRALYRPLASAVLHRSTSKVDSDVVARLVVLPRDRRTVRDINDVTRRV